MAFARCGAPIGLVSVLLLALVAPGAAFAVDGEFKLVLAPVGQAGPYFDLVMNPGEAAHLEVALGNDGSAGVAARTYATDVFTITNGGYGGRLRDAAQTGATTWLTYPTAVVDLTPGAHTRRALTVTVPADAGPGEYISSLVIENDAPIHGDGAIAFDQIVRQAIAVVITVPGARAPELKLGEAHHEIVAGRSVVTIAVENSGNVRLKPAVAFVLRDATRTEMSRTTFQMDTFYARTNTLVSVSLAGLLPEGAYSIELALTDASESVEATGVIDLLVVATATNAPGVVDGPGLTPVGPEDLGRSSGSMALVVAGLAIGLALLALGAYSLGRRRGRTRT
jgi:hypothetical protein